jgi:hypothetical protein
LVKRQAKGGAAPAPTPAEGDAAKGPSKPRSGRPITARLVKAAETGKPVAGPAKTRLLRALNHVLGQKKQQSVDLKTLF